MSYHPNLPMLALSSRLSRMASLPTLSTLVHGADLDGVEVDLSHRNWLVHAHDLTTAAGCQVPLAAIWLPNDSGQRSATATDASEQAKIVDALAASLWNPLLVLSRPSMPAGKIPIGESARLVDAFRREARLDDAPLVVALRASDLQGTREHLLQLGALRRAAEEWDFWIGLDLLGAIDYRWEAEAAVARLMPRLRLIRLSECAMRRSAGVHAYMTGRTIAAAFDSGFTGTLTLAPRMPIWRRVYPAAALTNVSELSQALRDRFALIAHIESLPRPTQFHRYL